MNRSESGSAAIEAVVGVPAFVLLVGLIVFAGRNATTHQAVESAAADAARSASIARDATRAGRDAEQAARTSLANQQIDCLEVSVEVDTDQFDRPLGETAIVEVTVSCRLDLADLSVPGVPGSHLVRASVASPLDQWKQRT